MLHKIKPFRACHIADRVRARARLRMWRRQKKAEAIYKLHLSRHRNRDEHARSPLACIISPHSEQLSSIPVYHRYVAFLVSESRSEAHKVLRVGRATLWRWMIKNNYTTLWVIASKSKARHVSKRKAK